MKESIPSLRQMEIPQLRDRLREFFAAQGEGVACAYLFGSVARGSTRPESDIDVAVLFEKAPQPTLGQSGIHLSGELERALGRAVDVVVLNRAPVDLISRVLRDGVIVFDRDPSARIQFEVRSRNAYFDLKPILDRYRKTPRSVPRG